MDSLGQLFSEWLAALWMVLAESGPYLIVGFVIAGVLAILIPAQWIARRMGGDDVKSVATAAIIGVPVPLCSCSVIPTATQLRRSGASRGATTSFLISTPETGVDSIGATWALMDPLMTVVRPLAAFATAFAAGLAVNVFGKEGETGPLDRVPSDLTDVEPDAEGGGSCCAHTAPVAPPGEVAAGETAVDPHAGHEHEPPAEGNLLRRACRYAFGTLLDDLTPWFLIGFAISGLIVVAVPDGFFSGRGLSGPVGMIAMLMAGVPLYVCATASTPIAAAMMAKGLEPGAALVFLLAGPATNVATMLVVRNLLGKRALGLYLASIGVMSLLIGTVVNRLYPLFGLDPRDMDVDPAMMEHGLISTVAGIALAVLLLRSAWRLRLDRRLGTWLRKVGAPVGLDLTAAPVKLAALGAGALVYGCTAVTAVGPEETVFIEQFGRMAHVRETPGAVWHAPWPIARVRRVSTAEVRALEFGIERLDLADDNIDALQLKRARDEMQRLRTEAEVVTADSELLAIQYTVQFRVPDPTTWTYGYSDAAAVVRGLAQEAVAQESAGRATKAILVSSGPAFALAIEARLEKALAAAGLGAELVGVQLHSVHAPKEVHRFYREVASALIERETAQVQAQADSVARLSEATIKAMEIENQARVEAQTLNRLSKARAEGFALLADADHLSGGLLRHIMALTARKESMKARARGQRSDVFVLSPHIDVQVFPAFGSEESQRAEEALKGRTIGPGNQSSRERR